MNHGFAPERNRRAENGVMIYDCRNEAQSGFFISLFVKAGILYESDAQWGITHFLEHIAIRNLNFITDGALYRELDEYGLEFNAATFPEMVQFYISGASEHFEVGAKYISMLLDSIRLPREDIDKERLRVKAEIREADDKSSLGSYLSGEVYQGTPLARNIMGSCTTLDKINGKRLEEYRRKVFAVDNVFFYVTGNVSDGGLSLLSELVGKYTLSEEKLCRKTVAPLPKRFCDREARVYIKNADYTMVRFQFDLDLSRVGCECCDLIYDILVSGYNSILFNELSEKRGICYDVTGGLDRYSGVGSLFFSFELRESLLQSTVKLVCELLDGMKRELIEESRCMKAAYVDNAGILLDDMRELNFTMASDNHILSLGYGSLDARRKAYERVTPEEIRNACREIFKRENLTLGIKGRKKNIDEKMMLDIICDIL